MPVVFSVTQLEFFAVAELLVAGPGGLNTEGRLSGAVITLCFQAVLRERREWSILFG